MMLKTSHLRCCSAGWAPRTNKRGCTMLVHLSTLMLLVVRDIVSPHNSKRFCMLSVQ